MSTQRIEVMREILSESIKTCEDLIESESGGPIIDRLDYIRRVRSIDSNIRAVEGLAATIPSSSRIDYEPAQLYANSAIKAGEFYVDMFNLLIGGINGCCYTLIETLVSKDTSFIASQNTGCSSAVYGIQHMMMEAEKLVEIAAAPDSAAA